MEMASQPEINNPFVVQEGEPPKEEAPCLRSGQQHLTSHLSPRTEDISPNAEEIKQKKKKKRTKRHCDPTPSVVQQSNIDETRTEHITARFISTKTDIYNRVATDHLSSFFVQAREFLEVGAGIRLPKIKLDTLGDETAGVWNQGNCIPKASDRGKGNRQKFQIINASSGQFLCSQAENWVDPTTAGKPGPWEFIGGTRDTVTFKGAGDTTVVLQYDAGTVFLQPPSFAYERVAVRLGIHPQRAALTRVLSDNANHLKIFYFQDKNKTGYVLDLAPVLTPLQSTELNCTFDGIVDELVAKLSEIVDEASLSSLRESLTRMFLPPPKPTTSTWADLAENQAQCDFQDTRWMGV